MKTTIYVRDTDNIQTVEGYVTHPGFGRMWAIQHIPTVYTVGEVELPEPDFPIGELYMTQGTLARHVDPETGETKQMFQEELRPYLERFLRGDWNLTDPEDRAANTAALLNKGEHVFDAFTHKGVRYNIEGYVGYEFTLMLASER